MIEEAVALSYLEWIRLIERGWIRFDRSRLVRYAPDREDRTDLMFDLMRNAPDVGVSSTDFILTTMRPVVLDKLHVPSCVVVGERLSLDTEAMQFHSFTENALAVHEHDARTRNIPIGLASRAFCEAWQAWSKVLADIAADIRGRAMLSKLHLPVAGEYHLGETMQRLAVEHGRIAKSQDTMCFGWAYVLNGLKNMVGPISLPLEVENEMRALQADFSADRPFLSRAPNMKDYFRTWSAKPNALPDCLETMEQADFLAIATLKHYERCNIKSEGRYFNYRCFQDDVREITRMNSSAAAFLVYQMGARLPDWIVASLQAMQAGKKESSPAEKAAELPPAEVGLPSAGEASPAHEAESPPADEVGSMERVETTTTSGAEAAPPVDDPVAEQIRPADSGGDPAPAAPDELVDQEAELPTSAPPLVGEPQVQEHRQAKAVEQQALLPAAFASGDAAQGGNEQLTMLPDKAPVKPAAPKTKGRLSPNRKRADVHDV